MSIISDTIINYCAHCRLFFPFLYKYTHAFRRFHSTQTPRWIASIHRNTRVFFDRFNSSRRATWRRRRAATTTSWRVACLKPARHRRRRWLPRKRRRRRRRRGHRRRRRR
uniref:Uncharacterized protein n=1 Tax=Oryza glumipatula TaxID=40148 RepID=A0A0D9YR48_9ORYZ